MLAGITGEASSHVTISISSPAKELGGFILQRFDYIERERPWMTEQKK